MSQLFHFPHKTPCIITENIRTLTINSTPQNMAFSITKYIVNYITKKYFAPLLNFSPRTPPSPPHPTPAPAYPLPWKSAKLTIQMHHRFLNRWACSLAFHSGKNRYVYKYLGEWPWHPLLKYWLKCLIYKISIDLQWNPASQAHRYCKNHHYYCHLAQTETRADMFSSFW